MKILKTFILLLLFSVAAYATNINHVVIQFKVAAKQRASLEYFGEAYEHKRILFINPSAKDSIISVTVDLNEDIILRSGYVFQKDGKIHLTSDYLYVPLNDTIKLALGNDQKLLSLSKNALIINEVIKLYDQTNTPLYPSPSVQEFENFYIELKNTFKANETIIAGKLANGNINKRAAGVLLRFAEADYYNQIFRYSVANSHIKLTAIEEARFEQRASDLQRNRSEQTRQLFEKYVQYLITKQGQNSKDIRNAFKYSITANWNRGLTLGFLHEQLSNYSPKSNGIFKSCFKQIREYAGDWYKKQIDTLEQAYFPIILQLEKIYLVDKQGKKMDFKQILAKQKGKLVLVDFWASWCVPCRQEAPFFEASKKKHQNQPITFLSLSLDEDDKTSDWVAAMKKDNGFQATNHYKLLSPKQSLLFKAFKIGSIPRYIIIDTSGKVLDSDFTRPSDNNFEKDLSRYLAKQSKL